MRPLVKGHGWDASLSMELLLEAKGEGTWPTGDGLVHRQVEFWCNSELEVRNGAAMAEAITVL